MTDQRAGKAATQRGSIRLSPSQLYCLAWAARDGDSRPPVEIFGVWEKGRLRSPRFSMQTWWSLKQLGLVELNKDDIYRATALGVGWLMENDLYQSAIHRTPCEVDQCRVCPNLS